MALPVVPGPGLAGAAAPLREAPGWRALPPLSIVVMALLRRSSQQALAPRSRWDRDTLVSTLKLFFDTLGFRLGALQGQLLLIFEFHT